jgi:hypothetical protein
MTKELAVRTRPLLVTAVVVVSMAVGNTALAHGGHDHGGGAGSHGGGGHGGGQPPAAGEAPANYRNASIAFDLSGTQVPGGGDPNGRAQAGLRLEPEAELVCLRSMWRELAGEVTAIHVHRGPEGQNGPHHIDLLDNASLAGSENRVEFCVQVTGGDHQAQDAGHGAAGSPADRIQAVVDDPGGFYLNVHTTAFPNGAVRGQLDG